jgi:hypothetical protein
MQYSARFTTIEDLPGFYVDRLERWPKSFHEKNITKRILSGSGISYLHSAGEIPINKTLTP